jgi:hypothetical protein
VALKGKLDDQQRKPAEAVRGLPLRRSDRTTSSAKFSLFSSSLMLMNGRSAIEVFWSTPATEELQRGTGQQRIAV